MDNSMVDLKPARNHVTALTFDLMTLHVQDAPAGMEENKLELYFDGGVVQTEDDSVKLAGTVPLLLKVNQMAKQDMDRKSQALAQKQVEEWLNEHQVLEGTTLWKKVISAKIPLQTAFHCAGVALEDAKEALLLNVLMVVLSEAFLLHKEAGVNFDLYMDSVSILSSILLGEEDYNQEFATSTTFPHFQILFSLCISLRSMLVSRGVEACNHFIFDVVECIEAQAWEFDEWWEDCVSFPTHPRIFYSIRKTNIIGLKPKMELLALYRKIQVDDKVRRDPLFELGKRQVAKFGFTVESILSLRKCLDENDTDNCLIMRARKKALALALDRTLTQVRDSVADFTAFEDQLHIKFKGTPMLGGLTEFCTAVKSIADAQVQWLLASKIYGEFDVALEFVLEKLKIV